MPRQLLYGLLLIAKIAFSQTDSLVPDDNFIIIKIQKPGEKAYSPAYMHYRTSSHFVDTNRFDTRYESFNYCRQTRRIMSERRNRLMNASFRLVSKPSDSPHNPCFKLSGRQGWLLNHNGQIQCVSQDVVGQIAPEMRHFRHCNWRVEDSLSTGDFKRLMRKKYWYDIRLEYDKETQVFTMHLKGDESRSLLRVTPVYNSKIRKLMHRNPDCNKMYAAYTKTLNKQRKRFDRRTQKQQAKMAKRTVKEPIERIRYLMSEEEKKMTNEEWMEYYSAVVLNEEEYLLNSAFYPELFTRYLMLSGYERISNDLRGNRNFNRLKLNFESDNYPLLVFYIDKQAMRFYQQTAISSAIDKSIFCDIRLRDDMAVIAVMNDGSIAIAPRLEFTSEEDVFFANAMYINAFMLSIEAATDYMEP